VALLACSAAEPSPDRGDVVGRTPGRSSIEPRQPPPLGVANDESRMRVQAMLRRVARARELPVKRDVPSRTLPRGDILARIRAHVDREIPRDVLLDQGESMAALGLVPASYDFVQGIFALLEGRIAGFYEPKDGTMYLVDDLDEDEAAETLAHELVHALQDQSYALEPLLKFAPGEADRLAAGHAVVEGDAMSAMLDVAYGSSFDFNPEALRFAFSFSTSLSTAGAAAPRAVQASLTAPYTDGFRLVQALRLRGGWAAVDAVWKKLPATTEQLLHLDKLDAREPAVAVAAPSIEALGAGWRMTLDEVMGEQGLSISLQEWAPRAEAERAAAGWGGDRYLIARKGPAPQPPPPGSPPAEMRAPGPIAFGWSVVMDSDADAAELAAVLVRHIGGNAAGGCRERPDLGPFAWARKGKSIGITGGPYERLKDGNTKSLSTCPTTAPWAQAIAGGAAPGKTAPPARPAPAKR
jgi:hypothetical protein